jgi:colanic acid biosynthesis glycosyl transferase WcaI
VSYFLSSCLAGLQLSKPDVIVALTDPPIIGLAALLAARHFGVPLVLSFRDIFPEVARLLEDFQSETVNRILDRINRFLLRQTDRAIALGETMRARLVQEKGASPDKVAIIPDWADCSQITPAEKRNPFSLAHGLADVFVVMHSGNIGLSQDLHILVEAAARLQDVPDLRIVFVGDGVKRPLLQQQAQAAGLANILFLPFQPKERLTESLAAADVFIVSLKEGLAGYIVPSKLYSILAAGRPYVAAVEPACEVATITRDYGCGLLADAGNAGDLAEKIRLLYENRNLARQMGATGRKVAETHFDRKIGVRAYFDLFTGLVDAASRLQENHG